MLNICTASLLLALVTPIFGAAVTKISKDATCGKASGFTCQGSQWGNCCSKNHYCGNVASWTGLPSLTSSRSSTSTATPTPRPSSTTAIIISSTSSSSTTSSASSTSRSSTTTTSVTSQPTNTYVLVRKTTKPPGCFYTRYIQSNSGLSSRPGEINDYAEGIAQCQSLCTANPACKLAYYTADRDTSFEEEGMCVLDDQDYDSQFLRCGIAYLGFTAAYQRVQNGGAAASATVATTTA
ncbi:hypothetical protein PspLS_10310 [Pyricularia sp. CBS 133598]|nr:hypothetical protein PspLS_10310 [Pyricularia sp. CBS 133598]